MSVRYIYNTSGDYVAFANRGYVFSHQGDWLGFVLNGNEVYQTEGLFVGYLLDDDRVARKLTEPTKPRVPVPKQPTQPLVPLKPLKRLKMPPLPDPYEDIFEGIRGNITRLTVNPRIDQYDIFEGAKLIAADNVYLGTISRNRYGNDSISNEYSEYGSKFSSTSIFNPYSTYGGKYSLLSPFNAYTQTPPRMVKDNKILGYLTANRYLPNAIDINDFLIWLGRH